MGCCNHLDCQADSGELATGGNLLQWFMGLSGVGGNQELDGLITGCAEFAFTYRGCSYCQFSSP